MEKTKIAMHLEEESKPIKKICEKLMDSVNHELDKGVENVDAKELGEVIDMIKDLYEAKKGMYEACYYKQIMEAMEEHDFEDEEEIMEEGRKGYRGRSRDSMGRFTSRRGRGGRRGYETMMPEMDYDEMERMRDMDRMSYNRMGYSGSGSSGSSSMGGSSSSSMNSGSMGSQSGSRGYSESRYDRARRGYEETKSMHKDNSSESKQMKMKSLEDYTKELASDITDMVQDMSAEEKNLLRTKLQTLAQKVS